VSARYAAEYVLPLRWSDDRDLDDLLNYLRSLVRILDVIVVDGSPDPVYEDHRAALPADVRILRPQPWPGLNGKVAGVVTGVRAARHERVVIADDDVRWDGAGLGRALDLLQQGDLIRPQNVYRPQPWHARWDTGRILLNRALGADYPGTYAVRRSTFLRMGGYSGDALFENLELARTVRAAGGSELFARDLFVVRRPATTRHFLSQRVRQAYDDLAQPGRLIAEAALLPILVLALRLPRADPRWFRVGRTVLCVAVPSVVLAELGRRRANGREVFGATAALWSPLWLLERTLTVWVALACRARGGVRYAGQRVKLAAHSERWLRHRLRHGTAAAMTQQGRGCVIPGEVESAD
jgi:hypothetical protein